MKLVPVALISLLLFALAFRTVRRERALPGRSAQVDRAVLQFGLPMTLVWVVMIGWQFLVAMPEAPMYAAYAALVPFICALGLWTAIVFLRLWSKMDG